MAIQAEQVPLTDFGTVADNAASGTRTIGGAIARTDISTGRQGAAAGIQDLLTGGRALIDPDAEKAYKSVVKKFPVTGKMLGRLENLNTMIESGTNANGRPLSAKQITKFTKQRDNLQGRIERNQAAQNDAEAKFFADTPSADAVWRQADPNFYAGIDRAQGFADQIGTVSPEAQRFLDAAGRGYSAGTISSRDAIAERARAVDDVQGGMLGQSLMQRAMAGIERGGRLSEQQTRDAIQAARQGFAARGLGTSSAALGAELLNRDRFARAREFEDLGFAQGVQGQDLGRQFQNQGVRAQMSMFDAGQANAMSAANADRALNAAVQNEQAQRLAAVTNNEMLYNAAGYVDGLRTAGLGASLQMAGVQQAANPLLRTIGFDPYGTRDSGSQAAPIAGGLAGQVAGLNSGENAHNANSLMYASAANTFRPSFNSGNSGMAGLIGGLGGAGLAAAGVALAPATFGTSLLPAMAGGFGLGAGAAGLMSS